MLRRLPTSRLIALIAVVVAGLGGGAAIALAAVNGSGSTPPAKPLNAAIHDSLSAPAVAGVTARITFTNRLIDKSSIGGGSPLLSGAKGRLWANADRVRLELQSDSGDAQVTSDGKTVTIVDTTQNQAYRITLPQDATSSKPGAAGDTPPTLARIDELLKKIAAKADVSGADPSNVAGREAYTVRVSPKHDGGLIGAAALAWDAANGTPLRAAVYAAGDPKPVLELKATDISFGKVADGDLAAPIPTGTKVTDVDLAGKADHADPSAHGRETSDPKAVAAQMPFALSAPDTLVGLPRQGVRAISMGGEKAALVTYGAGLGGIAVIEQAAAKGDQGAPAKGGDHQLQLPKISIGGTSGEELATALGTLVRFTRNGVQYVVVGSVPPAAAEAAARAL